jgi:DnaA family protein
MSTEQLTLSVSLRDEATFSNYFTQENAFAVQALQTLAQGKGESSVYLWGKTGTGRSHLLQAVCHQAQSDNLAASYLPLSEHVFLDPAMCEGLEAMDVICVDDIDAIARLADWEEALFHLFNRVRAAQKHIVFAATAALQDNPIKLPDLRSRLAWGLTYQLKPLSDEEKLAALNLRARNRGMNIPTEVSQFLFSRFSRDMNDLFVALDKLDQASLSEQRKITIPFIKQVLGL